MSFAIFGGQNVTRLELYTPSSGQWWADIKTDSDAVLLLGTAPDITIGEATWSGGEIIAGGVGEGQATGSYRIVGGAKWSVSPGPRSYRSAAGVRLRTVLEDIARDCGVSVASLTLPADRAIGTWWTRTGALPGASLLSMLAPGWYVDRDGKTVLRARSGGTVVEPDARISARDLADGWRLVSTLRPELFAPGLTFDGDVIASARIVVSSDGACTVEIRA